ncbi:hypothetical protein [Ruminococcus sp.]|uniref:hypothetical protein n=1 Tax=Ruminococcus sp. TaxID=41978 RepID=UPI0025FFEDF2|nr:hypothetical protein [Ruminococcus sp.]
MNRKLDLRILENCDMKTLEVISRKYKAVDDKEAEKIFRRIENYADYYEDVQVHNIEPYRRPVWRKICSVALPLAVVALTVSGGVYFNSQLKNSKNTDGISETDTMSGSVENSYAAISVTEDYKGSILGISNWHIEKYDIYEYDNSVRITFINDDTGNEFAYSEIKSGENYAYLADLDNDGTDEMICNQIRALINGENNDHAVVYRLRDGMLEAGKIIDNYEHILEEHDISLSSYVDFSDEYSPEKNKIIFKSRYIDTEYELGIEDYSFRPAFLYPYYINDNTGYLLGVKNWHISRESVTSDIENTYFINDATGEKFVEFTGYKDKTSVFLADLENDQSPEVVCNYQWSEDQKNMNNHVKIYRVNKGVLECGEFLSDFEAFEKAANIELDSCDDFTEYYNTDKNKIMLKKQDEYTEYELGIEYYHFKPVDLQDTVQTGIDPE